MYDRLKKLHDSDEYPMHMPGHKRKHGFGQIDGAVDVDITEIDGYDDLYEPQGFIKSALNRASKLFGSDHTFFLVNGSTVGILTALFASTVQRGSFLMARNCHKSVYHAAKLRELDVDYVIPECIDGMYKAVDPESVEEKLEKKHYDAVLITSPTYEGIVSDIKTIADICHSFDTVLIVDEAHGAHFGFHERFPISAVRYADIVIQSTHKTLPALTQTGLLHLNCFNTQNGRQLTGSEYKGKIDYDTVLHYLQIFQTSSPSYVLMSSIDSCLNEIERSGSKLWDRFISYRDEFDSKIKSLKYLKLIETDDPCKIVISVKGSGIYGPELSKKLLSDYRIQLEMASALYIVAIVTCNDTKEGFDRFASALAEIDTGLSGKYKNEIVEGDPLNHLLHTKAQDNIYIYPPGIPIVAFGEEIDASALDIIKSYMAAGLKIRGL